MAPTQRGRPDFLLLFLAFCLVGFGLVMVFSSSSAVSVYYYGTPWIFTQKQIMFALAGLVIMFVFMNIRVHIFKKYAIALLFLSVLMLLSVLIFGQEVFGAKRWISLRGIGVQPIEFVKLFLIIYMASYISRKEERIRQFKTGLLPVVVVISVLCALIILQPDFGSMIVVLGIVFIMLFIGGMRFKHMMLMLLPIVPVIALLIWTQKYRLVRIMSFMNPWDDPLGSGFHLIQSLYAFGHGGIKGVGFGQSIQKLHYLPAAHNDFIFPIIAEEFGLIGSVLFILVYLLFIIKGWSISMRSRDSFGVLLGTGIVAMISLQALINMGGVTGAIPITGITLPLISYGGSSLVVCMASVGILLSISRENNRVALEQKHEKQLEM